jgi:phosphoribosyl-AMP cyclohydrolase / phosphoribosyl-ATP pyrophosphohydrolase
MAAKKARKVKAKPAHKPKAHKAARRPVVVKRRMRGGDATPKAAAPSEARPAEAAAAPPSMGARMAAAAGAGLSRLQRMMAASSDNESGLTVKAKSPDMPGVAGEGEEDAAPVVRKAAAPPPPPQSPPSAPAKGRQVVVEDDPAPDDGFVVMGGSASKSQQVEKGADGLAVVSKGPAKFSADDIEALRKAIVIKGGGLVVAGINLDELKYNEEGLVAVVAQDRVTGAVLMQAWANKDALKQSLTTNEMTYFSRQRNKLWTKGEESGHTQKLVTLKVDCDKDSVLAVVEQTGPACHRDTGTCFVDGRAIPVAGFLGELDALVAQRAKDKPEGSYTTKLLEDPSLAAGKVVEEAKEVALVLKGKPNPDTLQHEAADLLYHLVVALRGKGVALADVVHELMARHGKTDEGGKRKA